MKLSTHFTLEELIASQYATRKGIDNYPKTQKLNDAISKIGSRSTHILGLAADFTCPQFGTPLDVFRAIKLSGIRYDQLILEFSGSPTAWVHIGFDSRLRQESLTFDGHTYRGVA